MIRKNFVFGVDLDGVVADFYRGLRPIASEWLDVDVSTLSLEDFTYGLPEWGVEQAPGGYEALHRFAVTQRALFRELPPIQGAPLALRKLSREGVRIRIITHRLFIKYFHKVAISQTIDWLDHHDIPYWDLCFMKDKAAVGADLYIDDTPRNIEQLRADGHSTIVFSNPTNQMVDAPRADNWNDAMEHVMVALKEWTGSGGADQELPGH